MMQPDARMLVWGAGGHGKVVADLVRSLRLPMAGYVDRDATRVSQVVDRCGGMVTVHEPELIAALERDGELPCGASAVALGLGDNEARMQAFLQLGQRAAAPLVHLRASVSPSASLGRASVVFAGAVLEPDVTIGDAVIVNSGAIICHDGVIGDGTHISPGAVLAGGVRVGAASWIGASAVVIQGVRIGARCMVGAGAVVLRDVPDGATVVGNPARQLSPK